MASDAKGSSTLDHFADAREGCSADSQPSPRTWFTSDLHLGHANILRYCNRPFRDVGHMNESLVRNWNDIVGPDDLVYLLGDFALTARERLAQFRRALQGRIVLIRGNHDRGPNALRACGFEEVHSDHLATIDGRKLYLRHIPIPDPDADWRSRADFHLCGHVHDKWRRRGNLINVGVDQWEFRPRSLAELLDSTPDAV